jgi:hypothetical protein
VQKILYAVISNALNSFPIKLLLSSSKAIEDGLVIVGNGHKVRFLNCTKKSGGELRAIHEIEGSRPAL